MTGFAAMRVFYQTAGRGLKWVFISQVGIAYGRRDHETTGRAGSVPMNSTTLKILEDAAAACVRDLGVTMDDLMNESVEVDAVARAMRRQYLHRWIQERPTSWHSWCFGD
jgi:hypothetical protein